MSNILGTELAPKTLRAEPSQAGRPPARAKSELSQDELNSVATLVATSNDFLEKHKISIEIGGWSK